MEQKTSYKESAPPTDARPRGRHGRWLWRASAAVALASVLGLLYWGGFEQVPRRHPFHAPDLAGWFLGRMPHPGHGQMPVVPAGGAGGLAPRGLCAPPADGCGGLEITADGRALLRLERTVEALARVRHMRETGHLFGVSAKGEVWQLTQGSRSAWRRAELPATAAAEYGKPGRFWQPQVLATLRGHGGPVWSAAFSPDGTRVVTASDDHVARLWDAATGAPLAILKGHDGPVTAAAFSPDGARIVTASGDGTARLWDAASGAALVTLEGHGAPVWSAAFSPDGMRIVTGSLDGMARLWDAATGATSVILEGHGDGIRSVAFSPDGTRVVTASDDGTARLWDAATGTTLFSLAGHRHQVLQAAFSPDGTRIVTASTDGTARLWEAATGTRLTATLEGGGGEMTSVCYDKTTA